MFVKPRRWTPHSRKTVKQTASTAINQNSIRRDRCVVVGTGHMTALVFALMTGSSRLLRTSPPRAATAVLFLGLFLLISLIWLLIVARPLLNALLVAGLCAYLLDPAVLRLQRRFHLQRPLASALIFLLTLLILLIIITI